MKALEHLLAWLCVIVVSLTWWAALIGLGIFVYGLVFHG